MAEDNRYAPPKAVVEGATPEGAAAPRLWNPNAAANWSLLFTPIFGSWLHMLNWRALGESGRAKSARTWLLLSAWLVGGLIVGALAMPSSGLGAILGPATFVLLLAWYFGSARGQARWVQERYGNDYRRQGWRRPLLLAAALWLLVYMAPSLLDSLLGSPSGR